MADNQKIADEIYNTIQSSVQKAHIVDGLDVKSARALVDIADTVLTEVEKLSQSPEAQGLSGQDKKDIAADVISRLITLDISWVPNFIEDKAKKYIVSSIIEFAVSWLDKKLGKDWLQ